MAEDPVRPSVDHADPRDRRIVMRVREANASDIAFIVDANVAMALETECKALDPEVLRHGVASVIARPERGFYLVAERAGQPVGCLLVTYEWSDWRNREWWWLQSVYVIVSARRGGVFRALHSEVERRASLSDAAGIRLYVDADNERAKATYRSLGMSVARYEMFEREHETTGS
jgi:ribosomal protein S18 acetylase RimI-like enzyme